jgi:hypothetical protein
MEKRRRLPTLIDRGLGLLEVILPSGDHDDPVTSLPPGQRDPGGFWFPAAYIRPADIFTPAQRKLQAKQRQVQRRRLKSSPSPVVPGSAGTSAAGTTPSRPYVPSGGGPAARPGRAGEAAEGAGVVGPADRRLPLPAPSPEAPEAILALRQVPPGYHAPSAALPVRSSLPDPERARVIAPLPIVDSHKGSD